VLAFSVVPALAQSAAKSAPATMHADQTFVTKAAQGGMAEVELGKLAADRASSPEVKSFAQKMVDDHGKANDELKAIATEKSIAIPASLDSKDKATYNQLSKLHGAAFDRAYMQDVLKDHRQDIADFQYEARSGADSDVRGFASKTLPTLQDHLKMAESTDGAVATSGTRKTSTTGTTGQK
jgi:putative membrane protein